MDIVEELSQGISAWIAVSPNRSRGLLQKRTGVSEPTLRRIQERDQKGVSLEIAMEIAHVIFDTDEAIAFLKRHFPVAGRWQEKIYGKKADVVTIGDLYRDSVPYKIILLCDTVSGSTIEEIRAELGSDGIRELSRLVELGFISNEGGRHKFIYEDITFAASQSVRFSMIQNMIKYFDPSNANIVSACADFAYSQGLTPEAIKLLALRIRELEEYINEICKDRRYRGDIPWFIGLVQNVLKGNTL